MLGKMAEWANPELSVSILQDPQLDSCFAPSHFISPFTLLLTLLLLLLLPLPFCRKPSITTRYGLGGTGIEFSWKRDFPLPSRPALEPTYPPE